MTLLRFPRSAVLVLTAAMACSPPKGARAPAQSVEDEPPITLDAIKQDPAAQFAREFERVPEPKPIRGHGWRAEAPGDSVVQAIEAGDSVSMPIHTDYPIECDVFPSTVPPAFLLGKTLEGISRTIEPVVLRPMELHTEQETSVYMAELQYQVKDGQRRLAGDVKFALIAHPSHTALCYHDEPGYKNTFAGVVRSFAKSLRSDTEVPAADTKILVSHVGDIPIGFSRLTVERIPAGGEINTQRNVELVPTSATALAMADSTVRLVTAGDRLIEGSWNETDTSGVRMQLNLGPPKNGKHEVEGAVDGKPVKGAVVALAGIASDAGIRKRLVREIALGRPFKFVVNEYAPHIDPLRLVESTYWRDSSDPPRTVHHKLGPLEFVADLDADGSPLRLRTPVGAVSIITEVAFRHTITQDPNATARSADVFVLPPRAASGGPARAPEMATSKAVSKAGSLP